MKKVLAAFVFVPFFLSAQQKFNITGNLQGLPDGSSVSLSDANNPNDTLAKGIVEGGIFVLNGSVQEPNLFQLNLDGVQKKSILFIGNENVSLKGNVETIQDLSVTGSAVHDDFEEFKKIFNPLFQQLTVLGQKLNSTPGTKKDDSLTEAYKTQLDKIKTSVDNFVGKHKNSPVAPFVVVVTSELEQDIPTIERRYRVLDKKAREGFLARLLSNK